jgi:hypothetical protein
LAFNILARALQPDHHDDRRRRHRQVKLGRLRTEHLDQGVVDDLDDLLARRDRLQNRLANRLRRHTVDKGPRYGKRDIRLEKRNAHLAHGLAHIRLIERTTAAQPVKNAAQPFAQTFEHAFTPPNHPNRKRRRTKTRRPASPSGGKSYFSIEKRGSVRGTPFKRQEPAKLAFLTAFSHALDYRSGYQGQTGGRFT